MAASDDNYEFPSHPDADSAAELQVELRKQGGELIVLHGRASEEIPHLARRLAVSCVFTNRDYEPSALARDSRVERALSESGIAFRRCKDQVIFEQDELTSQEGRAFTVFTAYRNAWLKRLPDVDLEPARIEGRRGKLPLGAPALRHRFHSYPGERRAAPDQRGRPNLAQ